MKKGTPARRPVSRRSFSAASLAGTYAFRFSGFSMLALSPPPPPPVPYYLVGVGLITLRRDGTLVGQQTSSTTPMAGNQAAILVCNYTLDGTVAVNPNGTGTASITFTPSSSSSDCAQEEGTFSLVVAGSNSIWLISTGATLPDGSSADEVVQIEAVRIS